MSAFLLGKNWESKAAENITDIIHTQSDWNFWGLVRNPIDKWVSAICQRYAPRNSFDGASTSYMERIKEITDPDGLEKFIVDGDDEGHTRKQSWHYKNIDNIKLHKLDGLTTLPHLNKASGAQLHVKEQIHTIIKDRPSYIEKLEAMFLDDMRLWRSAQLELIWKF